MEQDNLSSMWKDISNKPKDAETLRSMMQEGKHPVLKNIRRQLVIEILAFTAFLIVYYDFFDGDRKPLYANVLMVAGMLLVIIYNITGYMLTKRRIKGDNLKQSLEDHLSKMKVFAVVAVTARVLAIGCLVLFFTSVIPLNAGKYWIIAGLTGIFIAQMVLLSGIWMRRIRQMKGTIESFG